jgi:hypothetical protein
LGPKTQTKFFNALSTGTQKGKITLFLDKPIVIPEKEVRTQDRITPLVPEGQLVHSFQGGNGNAMQLGSGSFSIVSQDHLWANNPFGAVQNISNSRSENCISTNQRATGDSAGPTLTAATSFVTRLSRRKASL